MRNCTTTFVKAVGNLTLVAGVLGVMAAVPKIASAAATAKPGTAMMAKKTATTSNAAPKKTQVTGTITAINGEDLTIAPVQKKKKGTSVTVHVSSKTKIKIDGKAAKLSELKVGNRVTVKMSGSDVTSVSLSTVKKEATKKTPSKSTKPKTQE